MITANKSTKPVSTKIVLLGESGVGKTALAVRLSGDEFPSSESTYGVQSHVFHAPGNDNKQQVIFELGSEKAPTEITESLTEIAPTVALVLVDLSHDTSLHKHITTWKSYLINSKIDTRCSQLLVAARMDRGGSYYNTSSLQELAEEFRFDGVFQTSAKDATGIQELRTAVIDATRLRDNEITTEAVAHVIQTMAETLCQLIAKDGNALDHIEWRELERIVAIALDAIGFTVELTPGSKDGGKDVVASCVVSDNTHTFYIEIKHWRKGDRPGQNHISNFIELNARDDTDGGLFLSSSGYTSDVYSQAGEISRQKVRLGEREKIVSLCQHFVRRRKGVWYPLQSLPELLFEDTLD